MSFLNAVFLFGLAAGAIPLLVHLLSRRRARKREFPSIEFLKEILYRRIRRARLRQILLLLLRTVAITALAVALARPAISVFGGAFSSGNTSTVILIDNSLSMGARWKGESSFQKAVRTAKKIVSSAGSSDELFVVTAARPASSVSNFPLHGASVASKKIDDIPLSNAAQDLGAAFALSYDLAAGSDKLNKEVFIVSDFQVAAFNQLQDALEAPASSRRVKVFFCPVGMSMPNASIREAKVVPGAGRAGKTRRVALELYNNEPGVSTPFPVWLYQGETVVGESFADIPPGGSAGIEIAASDVAGGSEGGRAEIASDALDGDNKRYFLWGRPEPVKVLVLKQAGAGAEPFVETALGLTRVGYRPIEADVKTVGDTHRLSAAEYAVVVLTEVERLPIRLVSEAKDFLLSGGGLLILLDGRSDLRFYNDDILSELMGVRITGFWDGGGAFTRLKEKAVGHPVFSGFDVSPGEALSGAMFYKAVEVSGSDSSRVLAEFSNGLPAIVESGRVMLFTSGVDLDWNTLPLSGAFLPLLHQAVVYLAGPRVKQTSYLLVEEAFSMDVDSLVPSARVVQVDQWGHETKVLVEPAGAGFRLSGAPVEKPGVYHWRAGEKILKSFVANVDPAESALEPVDPEKLIRAAGGREFVLRDEEHISARLRDLRIGKPIWREFLLLSLACFVLEAVISRNRGWV